MEHDLLREGQVDALPPIRRFRFTAEVVAYRQVVAAYGPGPHEYVQGLLRPEGVEVIAVEELL